MPSLSDFGTLVGNAFVQNRFKDQAHPAGFCYGACLDWIRRTLGGGRSSLLDDPKHKRTADQQEKRNAENVQRMKNVYDRVNQTIDSIQTDIITKWKSIPLAEQDAYLAKTRGHGPWGYAWDSFAAQADQNLGRKRKFSDLSHVSGETGKDYATTQAFLDAAVKTSEFENWFETALLLGPRWKKNNHDNGGHAMVLYRQNTGTIQLFDPNFGCYQVDRNFKAAIDFLCNTEYSNWGTFYKGAFDRYAGQQTAPAP